MERRGGNCDIHKPIERGIEMNDSDPIRYAFPDTHNYGMTLRDYFAAKAFAAYYADGNTPPVDAVAEWAYTAADALMKARETT